MDFKPLLHDALKLNSETQNNDGLPRVERSLTQILKDTEELHSRVTSLSSQDVQAHKLLGTKGIDLNKITKKLETLSSRKTFEPLDPVSDTDIHNFLKNERENAILSIIEDVNKSSYESAQKLKWDNIMNEWKMEKVKLMNALIGPSQNWIDIRKLPEQTLLNESAQGSVRSVLNSIQMAYAREIMDYNKYDKAVRPSLIQKLHTLSESFNDNKVMDMWEIIKYMSNTKTIPRNQDPLKYRFQMDFVNQGKKYLERQYKIYMSTIIAEHLRESQRGGDPSNWKLVESYVGLKFRNPNDPGSIGLQDRREDNGRIVWPWAMAYYCMRCGDLKSALKCIETYLTDQKELLSALEEMVRNPDLKLSLKMKSQIKMQYKQIKIRTSDPYKRAVYCILSSTNEQHPDLTQTSDDYLWIQLSIIENEPSDNSDHVSYLNLQTLILEQYGEKHYNATEQPHLYFQVLALTGQFEAAIEFISRFERYRTHAVHFALGLTEAHLLSGPRNIQEPLLTIDIEDPKPVRRLNLARLVMLYVSKFEMSDPEVALHYYYFLRHLQDPDGKNLFLVCIADLVSENLNYDVVFGKMQRSGIRSRGLIDQFDNVINVQSACNTIADGLVNKGMFEDAIKMYDLASNQEQTLRYIIILLSQIVHQQNKPGSMRERLQNLTMDISLRYSAIEMNCDPSTMKTFNIFKCLLGFFDCYHSNNHEEALEILREIKLVPQNMNDLDLCVQNFKKLGGELCKTLPDLLLATMDIVYKKYKNIKSLSAGKFNDNKSEEDLMYLREHAKAITVMAASVPYRMPGETNTRLIQTEILMH